MASQAAAMASQIGTGLVDAFSKTDDLGYQSTTATTLKGFMGGMGTGPFGIGAPIGAALGFIKGRQNSEKEKNLRNAMAFRQQQNERNFSAAQLAADPTLATGTNEQSYFASGGGIHIKPSHRGRFTAYLKRTGSTLSEALHSKSAHVRQMANFARNAKKWKHEDGGYLESGGTMRQYVKCEWGGDLGGQNRSPLNDYITSGGQAKPLSSENAVIKGNSHAEGGVVMPGLDAEVEGGESTLNNFIFSKKLGFADRHIPIAKAKGIIEKKPRTLERANSLRRLMQREQDLAAEQEDYKQQMGIR
jgi:hypothetical protein